MSSWQWVVLGTATILLFWTLGGHNRLMGLRNQIADAYGQLAASLQQRTQAVTPLVHALGERLPGEQASLDALLAALAQHDLAVTAGSAQVTSAAAMSRLTTAEGELASALLRVQALLDRRGDLASDAAVQSALAQLHAADTRITFTRHLFNDAVLAYNDARAVFPTSVLARLFRMSAAAAL